jgi:hypothetical protein
MKAPAAGSVENALPLRNYHFFDAKLQQKPPKTPKIDPTLKMHLKNRENRPKMGSKLRSFRGGKNGALKKHVALAVGNRLSEKIGVPIKKSWDFFL